MSKDVKFSIAEAARLLDRSPSTLRAWDRSKSMPRHLRPARDPNGHRYWTPELIAQIQEWMIENEFYPGRAIYHPDKERLQKHIERIRNANKSQDEEAPDEQADALRKMVEEAVFELNVPPAEVISSLPRVVDQVNMAEGVDVPLDEALRVVADILARAEQHPV